ncbi:MAG: hypothetical protein A2Y25_03225 [Candidatus Melainabacteria bacterium GWF2_37_15]|nr:MAG: hypothetical protein A2Y25_03225 [Candidatus Melainabacteria bacterium GWF2_37_15]
MKTIKNQILAGILVCSITTSVVIGLICIKNIHAFTKKVAIDRLLNLSEGNVREFESFLLNAEDDTEDLVHLIQETFSFEEYEKIKDIAWKFELDEIPYISKYNDTVVNPFLRSLIKNNNRILSGYFEFDPQFLKHEKVIAPWYIREGNELIWGDSGLSAPYLDENTLKSPELAWFYIPKKTGKSYWTDIYKDKDINIEMISYTAPVFVNNKLIGIAGMDISLGELEQKILGLKVYKTGNASLLNKNFEFIYSHDFKTNSKLSGVDNGKLRDLQEKILLEKLVDKHCGVIEYEYKNKKYFINYHRLINDYVVLTKVPQSEVFSEVNRLKNLIIFLSLLIIVASFVIARNIAGFIVKPIERLTAVSKKLIKGDYNVKIDEPNSTIEINEFTEVYSKFVEIARNNQLSQEYIKAIIDNIPFMAWLKDKESKYIKVNEYYSKACNLPADDFSGKTDMDIWPKGLAEAYMKDDIEVIQSGKQKIIEEYVIVSGTKRLVETYKTPIYDKEGNIIGTAGIARDITERKEFEQGLLLKDKLLTAVADATNELVKNIDFNEAVIYAFEIIGTAIDVNRIVLFENKLDAETNKSVLNYKHEWVSDPVYKQINDSSLHNIPENLTPLAIVNTLLHKKPLIANTKDVDPEMKSILERAKVRSIMLFPIHIDDYFWGFVGFDDCEKERTWSEAEQAILQSFAASITSVVGRKQKRDQEKISQKRLSAVLENITDGIITLNERCIILSVNPAIEKMFGYTKEELIGQHTKILFPHEPCADCLAGGYACLKSDICYIKNHVLSAMDYSAVTKKGKTFYIETGLSEFTIEGETIGVLMVHDITQRKKVEKLKNEFISTVNHELRTPLTSIQGSLGLILSNAFGVVPDKAKELLNIANSNSSRLLNLINDILDIEKIEAGKMVFDKRVYEIMSVIYQAADENKSYAEKYNVNFSIEKNIEDAKVMVDKNRLIQVITNLLSNAAKFSPEGSEVRIIISKTDKNVRVSVADNGSGIPDEFKDRIFQKFSQVDSSDARKKGGTGLGLSICKSIIEQLGGQIGFESESGKGSVFYFDLPEYIEKTGEAAENSGKYRVLICEDDQDVASLIEILLKQIGCEVHIAKTAQETVTLLSLNKYQAITLDLILPDQEETYLLEYLSANENTKNLPIIVVSVKPPESFNEELISKCKIIDWIEKPIDHERLINSMKTTLKINGSSKTN